MLDGVAMAADVASFGIDTWAVDYGVLDCDRGSLIGPVRAYRDPRHGQGMTIVETALSWNELYEITGIQRMPINTIYQIAADRPQRLGEGTAMLMVPDLLTYWTTGVMATDITNASTTAMVDLRDRAWSERVRSALDLPAPAFLAPSEPGEIRGEAMDRRLSGLPLIGVATHDTASAFAGTPMRDRAQALVVSLGTWALVGAEVIGALPSARARELNITHEIGVDGTVRLLRNACGMWLLEECRRDWTRVDGREPSVPDLLDAALQSRAFAAVVDVDTPALASPGQTERTIASRVVGSLDGSRGALVRMLLESLVVRIVECVAQVEEIAGGPRPVIHVVGGASRLAPVMQWLADASGRTVVAGPVEATALGNAVVQWRVHGTVADLAQARERIALMPELREYHPLGSRQPWEDLASRLKEGS
jgi:rhamnulokinase